MNSTHYLEFMVFPARIEGRWILCLAHVEWSIHVPTWTLPAVETSIGGEKAWSSTNGWQQSVTWRQHVSSCIIMYLVIKPWWFKEFKAILQGSKTLLIECRIPTEPGRGCHPGLAGSWSLWAEPGGGRYTGLEKTWHQDSSRWQNDEVTKRCCNIMQVSIADRVLRKNGGCQ